MTQNYGRFPKQIHRGLPPVKTRDGRGKLPSLWVESKWFYKAVTFNVIVKKNYVTAFPEKLFDTRQNLIEFSKM